MQELSATIERVHAVTKYSKYYKEYKASLPDKAFFEEYKAQITLYENALSELKKSYSRLPNSRDILSELDNLQEKRIPSCKSILPQNLLWTSFTRYEKITGFIWVRRWRDNHLLINHYYIKHRSYIAKGHNSEHTSHYLVSYIFHFLKLLYLYSN